MGCDDRTGEWIYIAILALFALNLLEEIYSMIFILLKHKLIHRSIQIFSNFLEESLKRDIFSF